MSGVDPFKRLFAQAPVCICEIDRKGRLLSMNRAGLDQFGAAAHDQIIGAPYLSLVQPEMRQQVVHLMEEAFAGIGAKFEFSGARFDQARHFTSCFIPCVDTDGEVEKLIAISADISRRKAAEIRLRRMFRAQAVLARCNASLARSEDESGLLKAFCDNLVDAGGYAFAWIGYIGNGKRQRVRVMARAGWERTDFTVAALAGANAEGNVSVCRVALRRREPVVIQGKGAVVNYGHARTEPYRCVKGLAQFRAKQSRWAPAPPQRIDDR